jgi:cyclopropane fatty-acyl-phospholipid synthase-like methyltransferase
MEKYLEANKEYYEQGYEAENVESYVFRAYGRIFKHDFGLDGSKGERVLDFGCGSGSALRFFKSKGFNVFGADISETDLARARRRMPDIADNFLQIPPKPKADDMFFGGGFDLIISIQTLYFLSDTDMQVRLKTLYNMLKPGGYIYATMMGTQAYFSKYATPAEDGMSCVNFKNDRITYKDLYVNLTESKEDLEKKFSMFKKIYIGHYDRDYRNEGSEFHYTFTGQRPK